MDARRLCWIALAALAAPGCQVEETSTAQAGSPTAAAGAAPTRAQISARCRPGTALKAGQRKALVDRAQALYQALRTGATETLWDSLHPQAQSDDQRDATMQAFAAMQARLSSTPGEPQVGATHLVDLSGGANDLARVTCGAEDDPDRFTLVVNAGGEDVGLVTLRSRGAATELATTVQLRRRGERWRLLGIQVNPAAYRGKGAADYEALAERYAQQQKIIPAYFLLALAQTLSQRGASITSARHVAIKQRLAALERDQLFAAETRGWRLGDARVHIQGLSLVSTRSDISPVFKYVSPQGLVEDLLDRDADALVEEVHRRFPALLEHFDAVVFEAYAEQPDRPGRDYSAYRKVRYLDPARRRDSGA